MSNKQKNSYDNYITNLVLEYQQAKKDNLPEWRTLKNKIISEIFKSDTISDSDIIKDVRKIIKKHNKNRIVKLDNDPNAEIWEVLESKHLLDTFYINKNDNFIKCLRKLIDYNISNKSKKANSDADANMKDSHGNLIKDERGKQVQYKTCSINVDSNDDEHSSNYINKEIDSCENMEENVLANQSINMLFSIINYNIIHFLEHKGKAFNSTGLMYRKMFYTETIIKFFNKFSYTSNNINSQQIFSAIDVDFLDMVMKSLCREVSDITYSSLKKYYEILEDISEDKKFLEIEVPFINKIFIKYVELSTGDTVSDASISQQKKKYKESMDKWLNRN